MQMQGQGECTPGVVCAFLPCWQHSCEAPCLEVCQLLLIQLQVLKCDARELPVAQQVTLTQVKCKCVPASSKG